MRFRLSAILLTAVLCLAPTVSLADLAPFSQDFEGLDQADPASLTNDGWLVFANVFTPGGGYLYGYGPFPAPNGGPGFSGIDQGQGGPAQGDQQLVTYSDYNNGDHANGNLIEANVFQEQIVGAADVGSTWFFDFDAKRGNIAGATTALAFFKTLDPAAGFALTNFITVDMTFITPDWAGYSLAIYIDPSLEGQILQFGFLNLATNYESSGIFYDNVNFYPEATGACCTPLDCNELPPTECVGQYAGDFTTCGEATCEGPLFFTVCHAPPGNPANAHTITVGYAAAQAHLGHGDSPGQCGLYEVNTMFSLGLSGFGNTAHIQQTTESMQQSEEARPFRRHHDAKSKVEGARSR